MWVFVLGLLLRAVNLRFFAASTHTHPYPHRKCRSVSFIIVVAGKRNGVEGVVDKLDGVVVSVLSK